MQTTEKTYTLEQIKEALPFPLRVTPELQETMRLCTISNGRDIMTPDKVCLLAEMLGMEEISIDAIPIIRLAFAAGTAYAYQDLWNRAEHGLKELEKNGSEGNENR